MENICKFVLPSQVQGELCVMNFVYEKEHPSNRLPMTNPMYRVCIVTKGTAVVTQANTQKCVEKHQVFFLFASVPYTVDGSDDFEMMYISFIGIRANALMERYGICSGNFAFAVDADTVQLWQRCIAYSDSVMELCAESLVLFTMATVADGQLANESTGLSVSEKFLHIKKYIDENFSDPDLTIEKLSEAFSYNKKYLSSTFKTHFKIGISDYISIIRINHACNLMDKNYKSVSDIAFLCGFYDASYFSKVFKKRMKQSPREYIREKNETAKE